MGIPTLIKAQTASDSASLDFVDGTDDVVLDSTYDEYMFVFTDINPASDGGILSFQVNATDDAGGDYDTSLITSTYFNAEQAEAGDPDARLGYQTGSDLAQSASFQPLTRTIGNGSDESAAGVLHLFNPSSTTFVKHFYSRVNSYFHADYTMDNFVAGYINDTTAIDEIKFYMDTGNFDGVIQLYGIA